MIKNLKILLLVVLLGGLFFGNFDAFAVDPSERDHLMTISPPIEKMILMPGEVYEGSIDVSNPSSAKRALKYSVYVGSFSLGKDENGNTDYNFTDVNTVTSYNQIMEWIELGKESGSVAPGATDTVSYKITVPEDTPAGGQYASIIFRDETDSDNEASGDVVIQNVVEFAVSILAEVTGETKENGAVVSNNIPAFVLNNLLEATSVVRNDGNVHTNATYTLQVWPLFSDEEVCTNEEEPVESLIMPETERHHGEICSLPRVGIYKVRQTVKMVGDESVAEKMIIFCPVWLLFIILFAILLLIIWVVMKVKQKKA